LAHATLRSALSEAQRLQLVSINAATLVKVPKPKARAIRPLTVEQAMSFLKVAEKHRLGTLFSVALACGLRLGEATGLRWDDVDLTSGEVRIRQQLQRVDKRLVLQDLKTAKSHSRPAPLGGQSLDRRRRRARRGLAAPRTLGTSSHRGSVLAPSATDGREGCASHGCRIRWLSRPWGCHRARGIG
jgi:integrase